MRLLENKTALITGASRGIGKAIALCFAQEGCNIAFTYLEDEDMAMKTRKELLTYDINVLCYQSDASNFEAAHNVINTIVKQWGKIDILVNNAGIAKDSLLLRMTEQQWDSVLNVNLKSAFNYIHAVTPHMIHQRSGSIISLSSVVAFTGNAGQANYAASKAGIVALTKSTAKELGSRGIRANCVAPGFIKTDMTASLPAKLVQEYEHMIPLHRFGTPEDVAKVVLFLASDLAGYVSGEIIHINGAMS